MQSIYQRAARIPLNLKILEGSSRSWQIEELWSGPAPDALLAGPERIESGWWDGEAADVCRDYFVARRPDHSLVWVFRERRAPHGWFLHGYFA